MIINDYNDINIIICIILIMIIILLCNNIIVQLLRNTVTCRSVGPIETIETKKLNSVCSESTVVILMLALYD